MRDCLNRRWHILHRDRTLLQKEDVHLKKHYTNYLNKAHYDWEDHVEDVYMDFKYTEFNEKFNIPFSLINISKRTKK